MNDLFALFSVVLWMHIFGAFELSHSFSFYTETFQCLHNKHIRNGEYLCDTSKIISILFSFVTRYAVEIWSCLLVFSNESIAMGKSQLSSFFIHIFGRWCWWRWEVMHFSMQKLCLAFGPFFVKQIKSTSGLIFETGH